MDDNALFNGLTDAQRTAVEHLDGPMLVLAGPGSGKTTVVTRRVAWLIAQGIPPWQILALTFTNKAAGEMRERIDALLPHDIQGRRGLVVSTFHAYSARLLRSYGASVGLDPEYTIYDSGDQRDVVKRAIAEAGLESKHFTPGAVASAISAAKNDLRDADAYESTAHDFYERAIARAFHAYQSIMRASNAVDFDDLLLMTARLVRDHAEVRQELQDRHQYLLIDEYQDTNHAQFVIADALAEGHRNLAVVGDPDQSIYGWRGADITNILEFEDRYPESVVVPLGCNFRSTGYIVACADTLIRHNTQRKDRPLTTELEDGERPVVARAVDARREAAMVAARAQALGDEGVPFREMAVLYRTNALSRELEGAFRDAQIPYVIARGTAFYDRKEIRDALAYLRIVANPADEFALRRIINVPARGIGRTSLDRLDAWAAGRGARLADAVLNAESIDSISARARASVARFAAMVQGWSELALGRRLDAPAGREGFAALVEQVVRESGLESAYRASRSDEDLERLENLAELVSAAASFTPPEELADDAEPIVWLRAFLESIALVSDADAIDPDSGAVTLMTLHAAKGLEFESVTIVGLEAGLLPHAMAEQGERGLEEERRLCYVGMTRAKRRLLMTSARQRMRRGVLERTVESPFLSELPAEGIEVIGGRSDGDGRSESAVDDHGAFDGIDYDPFLDGAYDRDDDPSAVGGLQVGAMVRHPRFGVGRVRGLSHRPAGASAQVDFVTAGAKTLILEYARLEVLHGQ